MATTAADRVFVDTNVLIYAATPAAPLYATALQRIDDLQRAGAELWISRQILREFLAAVTRPQTFSRARRMPVALAAVARIQNLYRLAEDGSAVTNNLLALCAAVPLAGKQVHDANVVATMQAYSIAKLLTHNTADFTRFQNVIMVLPLVP
jgi:predicted nucleic acid-binding protein